MNRLGQLWLTLRSSLWFAPSLLVLGAIALAALLIEVDVHLPADRVEELAPLLPTSAEGARAMLAAIAGSMMTVAGVVFSITIVTLSLASSQYSPRVLRGFMKNASNQIVLGVFVGIFTYCIVVLGAIRTDHLTFVPSVAVLGGAVLALVGVAFLIHFIHHTATAIQASEIVATAAAETEEAIRRAFAGSEGADPPQLPLPDGRWTSLPSPTTGYVQRIDQSALTELAVEKRCVLRLERRVGDFVAEGAALVSIPGSAPPDERLRSQIGRAISIGRQRTVEQDPAWGLQQIADVAARALSPGINDSTTAITCVQYLGALLAQLARSRLPSGQRIVGGELRLAMPTITFADMVAVALDDVRQAAAGQSSVLAAVLDCLGHVADAGGPAVRRDLRQTLESVEEVVVRSIPERHDRSRLLDRVADVSRRLARGGMDESR